MTVLLVVNDKAVSPALARQIAALAGNRLDPSRCVTTTTRTEFRKVATAALAAGTRRFVIAGGDGTVAAAANVFAGTDVEVGVLPVGRANRFACGLGLPEGLEDALEVALGPSVAAIDLGRVHCRDHAFRALKVVFTQVAEAGFAGHAARRSQQAQRWLGRKLGDRLGRVLALRDHRAPFLRLAVDGVDAGSRPTSRLLVGAAWFSGQAEALTPGSRIDTGHLDVCRRGDEASPGNVGDTWGPGERMRALRVEATSDDPVPIAADGEMIGWLPAAFEILPGALRVAVPPERVAGR